MLGTAATTCCSPPRCTPAAATAPTTSGSRAGTSCARARRSLRRLGTDHIDVYHVHGFDGCTPLEESLGALDRLVRAGKVRYIACSNYAAWQLVARPSASRERRNLDRYVAVQAYYSLVARELEWDIIPACRDTGARRARVEPARRRAAVGKFDARQPRRGHPPGAWSATSASARPTTNRRGGSSTCAREIADARGVSVAQVALNWLRARRRVSSVIVGARTEAQLDDNLAAATWQLTQDETRAPRRRQRPPRALPALVPPPVHRRALQPRRRPTHRLRLRQRHRTATTNGDS